MGADITKVSDIYKGRKVAQPGQVWHKPMREISEMP